MDVELLSNQVHARVSSRLQQALVMSQQRQFYLILNE